MRESFVFYKSFYEAIEKLPEEYQLEVIKAIMEYNFNGITPELSPIADAIFTLIKANLDSASARYDASVENGKKGGAPAGNQNAKKQPKNNLKTTQKQPKNNLEQPKNNLEQPKNNLNDNVNDNVNDNDNDNVVVATPSAITFYLNNINSTPVAKEMEILESYQKDLPDDVLIYGMEKAVEKKARNLSYIKAIWNSWISKGITTLAEAQEETKPKEDKNITDLQKYRNNDDIDYEQYYANL
jgi:DnaD/phage-associated family protein